MLARMRRRMMTTKNAISKAVVEELGSQDVITRFEAVRYALTGSSMLSCSFF